MTQKKYIFRVSLFLIGLFYQIFHGITAEAQNLYKREVRAVWVATVKNIDWPSSSDLPAEQQKHECIRLLDLLRSSGINTIFFQVRSSSDAMYSKSREPWAEWISGEQGRPPNPFYDPLSFFIEQAHIRGMELHAWINPYRAVFDNVNSSISQDQISKTKPEWVFKYGGKTMLNPGIPEVRTYIESVINDLVEAYDLDGIHLDDYFYPYPVKGKSIPDQETFKKYQEGFTQIDTWRRNNINNLVREIYEGIKSKKSYVKFGISPFGIWKNNIEDFLGSDTHGGSSFKTQYADSRFWLEKGWVDYLIPQIYFTNQNSRAPFKILVDWWNKNSFSRPIYIGLGAYRIGEKEEGWTNKTEIEDQIKYSRSMPNISGNAFYNAHAFLMNELGFVDSLKNNLYKDIALPPAMKWIDSLAPEGPNIEKIESNDQGVRIFWNSPKNPVVADSTIYYILYRFKIGEEEDIEDPHNILKVLYQVKNFQDTTMIKGEKYIYRITACDRLWNESTPSKAVKGIWK